MRQRRGRLGCSQSIRARRCTHGPGPRNRWPKPGFRCDPELVCRGQDGHRFRAALHADAGGRYGNADIQDFTAGGTFIYNFAFFNNTLYTSVPLEAYTYNPGTLMLAGSFTTTPAATTTLNYTAPVASANGVANGVVWTQDGTGEMHAYTPALTEIYNTSQAASGRDTPGTFVKFSSPVIANGKVYVGGQGSLAIYGLLP